MSSCRLFLAPFDLTLFSILSNDRCHDYKKQNEIARAKLCAISSIIALLVWFNSFIGALWRSLTHSLLLGPQISHEAIGGS